MLIAESGALICSCGNQELVLVTCLPPWQDTFVILCRKCGERGGMFLSHTDNSHYKVITYSPSQKSGEG